MMFMSGTRVRVIGLVAALAAGMVLSAGSAPAVGGGSAGVANGTYTFAAKLDVGTVRACSGALVAPDWVLTAKSCFPENSTPGAPALPTKATIGRTSLSSTTGHVIDVVRVVPRGDRDVALVRLARPVTDVAPIKLGASAPASGDVVRVAGYGRTATEWVPDRLHAGNFGVQSLAGPTFAVEGTTPESATVCRGDAGGPAFRDNNGTAELVGLTASSWQGGCLGETETRRGAVEVRTDDITDWIVSTQIDPLATPMSKSITISWRLPNYPVAQFKVYASADPAVPIQPATLLTQTGRTTSFVHSGLKSKQAWHYRVVPVNAAGQNGPSSVIASATTTGMLRTDFTGDRKGDIATFLRGTIGDVYVAPSTGERFLNDNQIWNDDFALGTEYPLSGDFNGDGKADIVTFTRGTTGDVYVALSNGTTFEKGKLWHTDFAYGSELPAVGDFNGDGKDDLAVFTLGTAADVYVSLSDGTKFVEAGSLWNGWFAQGTEFPSVGDFDGDGKDDIVTFTGGSTPYVYVGLSTGTSFQAGTVWHDWFAPSGELPGVGDFNGDGKDDVVTFTSGSPTDVYVGLSNGTNFGPGGVKWYDDLAAGVPGAGDFDGDGKDDIVTFTRGSTADANVSLSNGSQLQAATLWHDWFAPFTEIPQPRFAPLT